MPAAAMLHMPSWYCTLWKAIILIQWIYAIIFMVIMTAMGITSFMG